VKSHLFRFFEQLFRRNALILPFLFLLSGTVRILARMLHPTLDRDAIDYLNIATEMARISRAHFYLENPLNWIPPFYVQLVGLGINCGFPAEGFGVGVNLFLGALLPVVLFLIAEKLFQNRAAAVMTGVSAAFAPVLVDFSIGALREPSYFLFFALFFYALLRMLESPRWYWAAGCGAFTMLAYFCRFEGLETAVFFLAAIAWAAVNRTIAVPRALLLTLSNLLAMAATLVVGVYLFAIPLAFLGRQIWRLACRRANW